MTSLADIMGRSTLKPKDLIEAIGALIESERDLGMYDSSQVIALLGRCSPSPTKEELVRLRHLCQQGVRTQEKLYRANSANDFGRIADRVDSLIRNLEQQEQARQEKPAK